MSTAAAARFSPREREALKPPERLPVSQWVERNRVMPEWETTPGPWRNDVTPYLVEIMDAFGDPAVRRLVLQTSTQVGKTECLVNCLLYSVANNPAPALFVLPSEDDAVSMNNRRLKSAVDLCEPVAAKRTDRAADWKNAELGFHGMVVYFGWAGSSSKLASKAIGILLMDEVNKYSEWTGREADPISLARERLRWRHHDSKEIIASTPTFGSGNITVEYQASDRRRFLVPCHACGEFQAMEFLQVRWPKSERDPDKLERERLAWYECSACKAVWLDDHATKAKAMRAGVWCPEGATVDGRGRVHGATPGPVRGYHLSALYSPVLTWSDVAAEFLRSKDSPQKLLNFRNSWEGLPWVETSAETTLDHISGRQLQYARGTVPLGALVLTAGVDVKKAVLHYTIRAWGHGERSWLVDHGEVEQFNVLAQVLFHRGYKRADGTLMPVRLAAIDYQYREDEVLAFCGDYPEVARPVRGRQHQTAPITTVRVERDALGRAFGLQLWSLDTAYFKDKLNRLVHAPSLGIGAWHIPQDVDEEYLLQMVAEHKTLVRGKGGKVTNEWVLRTTGAANHYFDTEVYSTAAADMLGVYTLRDETPESLALEQERATQLQETQPAARRQFSKLAIRRAGFLSKHRRRS